MVNNPSGGAFSGGAFGAGSFVGGGGSSAAAAEVDAGERWKPNTPYKADESFTHNVTQTTAVDVNGDAVPQGLGLFAYTVDTTSGASAVLAEIATWTRLSRGDVAKLNSQVLAGPINADAILADFVVGEAFHFHTVGDVTFNTAGTLTTIIDGEANVNASGPTAAGFGTGIRGILSKTVTGVSVEYVTQADDVADIFKLFDAMTLDNGASPVVAATFGEFPSVILEDASSDAAHYSHTSQLPLTDPQTVRIKLRRDPVNGQTFLLRSTGAGTQELIINLQTGEVNVSNGGAGVDPVVNTSHVDTDTITVIATFQPNAGITSWDHFPAVGLAGIVGGGGYSGTTQGTVELLEIDYNFAQGSERVFDCVEETILTPGSDWNISGAIAGTTNFTIGSAGQQDGVAEYNYATPVGRRGTKHIFEFELGAVTAGGNDIALRVEVEQGGEILESQDLLTNETDQPIALEFFPTADVIIRIRDTSTGSQGSNRDAAVRDMQLVASCEGRSLSADENTTTAIFEGVFVDAAPAIEPALIMADNQVRTLETGLNLLTDVDHIRVSYARNVNTGGANLWASPVVEIRIEDILLGITQGMLINHFDNQFLSVTTTTEAELIAGNINFRAESNNTTFGYEITRVEFRKRAVGSSPLIGFKFEGPPNLESTINGVLEIRDRTVPNGAADNPIFAARWPSLVSGNDIVIPADFEGAFSRNLGGNAAAFETFQGHAQAFTPNAPTGTQVNSGGGNTVRGRTAGPETRPDNFGMQWYFIMDDYVDPTSGGGTSGQPLVLAYATNEDQENPNTGDNVIFTDIENVSGGVTIDAAGVITLPQSPTPYKLSWDGGFDFDDNPDAGLELTFTGATPLLSTTAEFDVFDVTAEGASDADGANVTFSIPQFIRTKAFALFDASAGPLSVQLEVTIGANEVDISEGLLEVSQAPASSVVTQTAALTNLNDLGDSAGAITISFAAEHNAKLNLTGDVTLTFEDPITPVARIALHFIQDAAGGHIVTWPANILGAAPVINPAAGAQPVVMLYFDGTNYHVGG